jgi:hypothetical protein
LPCSMLICWRSRKSAWDCWLRCERSYDNTGLRAIATKIQVK